MEESRDLLRETLEKSGVEIPGNVSSLAELSPEALVSICAQLLNLVDRSASFCSELPDSLADRFRTCTDIALSVKNLGYIGDMSYYKFLYPSEEDSNKLIRFLVERLSETNEETKPYDINVVGNPRIEQDNFEDISHGRAMKDDNETFDVHIQKVEAVLKDLRLASEISLLPESRVRDDALINDSISAGCSSPKADTPLRLSSGNEETSSYSYSKVNPELTDNITSEESSSKIKNETIKLQHQEKILLEELKSGSLELHNLDNELELLKVAMEKVFDDKCPIELYLEQLKQQLSAKRCNLMDRQRQWNDVKAHLETKKINLINCLYAEKPESQEKLEKLRDIEQEKQLVTSETQMREEERCKLQMELEKQPKVASRKSYIKRVKEITRNSRKVESDIERILRETRELQLESNSILERLHRTYAVVDEMVLREAKKDAGVRPVYKLVTNIHGIFEQIVEKILMTDRLRREASEHEKKLEAIAGRGMNLEKLQADLDAIKRDNQRLEQELNQV